MRDRAWFASSKSIVPRFGMNRSHDDGDRPAFERNDPGDSGVLRDRGVTGGSERDPALSRFAAGDRGVRGGVAGLYPAAVVPVIGECGVVVIAQRFGALVFLQRWIHVR
jgi:hypothetical protein